MELVDKEAELKRLNDLRRNTSSADEFLELGFKIDMLKHDIAEGSILYSFLYVWNSIQPLIFAIAAGVLMLVILAAGVLFFLYTSNLTHSYTLGTVATLFSIFMVAVLFDLFKRRRKSKK